MAKRGRTSRDSSRGGVPAKWAALIRSIPGYDPIATASSDHRFDPVEAQLALDFFPECLIHVEGEVANRPFTLERWQQAIVANLFGWIRRSDGTRRYREAYIQVPRKNGKTTLTAGLGLFLLLADGEPGAQVYCAASDAKQARLLFRPAKFMVKADPALDRLATCYADSIEIAETRSIFRVLSKAPDTKHGLNSHANVIDELHAQPSRDLVDVLKTGTAARRQPVTIYITTAGWDRNSICYEKYQIAKRVIEGTNKRTDYLPVIYELPEGADWTDEKQWAAANPNLGVSVKLEYLREQYAEAVESASYENTFRRLHLNTWTEQAVRWIPIEKWDRCESEDVTEESLEGRECFGGLDLASTSDLTAFVLVFPDKAGGYDVLAWFWIPGANVDVRGRRDGVPYRDWVAAEWIEATSSGDGGEADEVTNYGVIRRRINELRERYVIREIGFDPWNATQLVENQLAGEDGLECVKVRQGFATLSAPTKECERLIRAGDLRHDGNPVLRWCFSNCAVRTDEAGNLKPDKKRSTEKIDGVVALVTALSRAMAQAAEPESVYKRRGLMTL